MSVFVDDMRASFGRMVMCHMIADSTDELLAMADRIGVSRRWLQDGGTHREHFDISLTKRAQAVAAGAIEVTQRQLAERIFARRGPRSRASVYPLCRCPAGTCLLHPTYTTCGLREGLKR